VFLWAEEIDNAEAGRGLQRVRVCDGSFSRALYDVNYAQSLFGTHRWEQSRTEAFKVGSDTSLLRLLEIEEACRHPDCEVRPTFPYPYTI
jgi:hypothetical protein